MVDSLQLVVVKAPTTSAIANARCGAWSSCSTSFARSTHHRITSHNNCSECWWLVPRPVELVALVVLVVLVVLLVVLVVEWVQSLISTGNTSSATQRAL